MLGHRVQSVQLCTVVYSCVWPVAGSADRHVLRGVWCLPSSFAALCEVAQAGSSSGLKVAQSGSKSGISPFRLPAQSGSKPEIWPLRLPPISRSTFRSAFRSAPSRGNFADFSGSLLRKSACSKKSAGGRIGRMAKTCQRKPPSTGRVCKRTCKTSQRRMAKIRCGYRNCTKLRHDCKNSSYVLSIKNVNPQQCRCLRKHAQSVRFCTKSHMNMCKLQAKTQDQKKSSGAKRQGKGRVPLTAEQVGILFRTLVQKVNCAWAGALCLLQLFLGDRADAARQASTEWFRNLNPDSGNPPTVAIPDCNDKTTVREVYLSKGFAALLWHWVLEPLKGRDERSSWPHPGQNLHSALLNMKPVLLFPGRVRGGKDRRNWKKAISEKAYYDAVRSATGIIQRERAQAHRQGGKHPYDDVDLDRLGTHSMKKTCVTELCEQNVSPAVISQLTGTTEEVLLCHYYQPSQRKQQEAVSNGLAKVVAAVSPKIPPQEASAESYGYCSHCGMQRKSEWYFCPKCGTKFHDMA